MESFAKFKKKLNICMSVFLFSRPCFDFIAKYVNNRFSVLELILPLHIQKPLQDKSI